MERCEKDFSLLVYITHKDEVKSGGVPLFDFIQGIDAAKGCNPKEELHQFRAVCFPDQLTEAPCLKPSYCLEGQAKLI